MRRLVIQFFHLTVVVLAAGYAASNAQAQVLRCSDPRTGQVTYTDGTCPDGNKKIEVEARKTEEEIQRERETAADALAQKRLRLRDEASAEHAEVQRERENGQRNSRSSPNYAASAECARSRRQLDTAIGGYSASDIQQRQRVDAAQRQVDMDCLGPKAYTELERSRPTGPVIAPTPVIIAPHRPRPVLPPVSQPSRPAEFNCNVFRCHDKQGNIYPR